MPCSATYHVQTKTRSAGAHVLSDFASWIPRDYLRIYCSQLESDDRETMKYLVDVSRGIPPGSRMLEFGSGPTVHRLFPAVPRVSAIHVADYLDSNLDEVRMWLEKRSDMHSWTSFVAYTLQSEGIAAPTPAQIDAREADTRGKVKLLLRGDANRPDPLGELRRGSYDVVYSCYCADSATRSKKTWRRYMKNISTLVAPGGFFVVTALRRAKHYKVGSRHFPSADVDEHDLLDVLRRDFSPGSIAIEIKDLPEHQHLGYTGLLLAHAMKRA